MRTGGGLNPGGRFGGKGGLSSGIFPGIGPVPVGATPLKAGLFKPDRYQV